jgi:anti-sigma factor RsiW
MNTCAELEALRCAHASGALPEPERIRVEAHLAECPGCAAEDAELREVLDLASLPAPSELELAALHGMPGQVRAAWSAQERTKRSYWRATAGGMLALAASLLVLLHAGAPARTNHPGGLHPAPSAPVALSEAPLTLDSLSDGPLELADDGAYSTFNDPEANNPTADLDEGEY